MLLGRIKSFQMPAILLLAVVALSGCNTITGAVGGVGKDISMIGNTLSGVSSANCHGDRCNRYASSRSCGRGDCRTVSRRVVNDCGSSCGRSTRTNRYERVSYRERYAYRDRYSTRRDRHCC